MTPAELATILEAYAARHAADSALWERVLPEAAKALRASATAVEAEREACAQVAESFGTDRFELAHPCDIAADIRERT